MSQDPTIETIPTSGQTFRRTGGTQRFAHWLHTTCGDMLAAEAHSVAQNAAQALDLLGAAAPSAIRHEPAAAAAFLDKVDLTLLGVESNCRGELKRAVAGLHAWALELDGPATRALLNGDAGPGAVPPPAPARDDGPAIPVDGGHALADADGHAGYDPASPGAVDSATLERVEMPPGFACLETAAACELARREAVGQTANIVTAGRKIILRQSPDTRRRVALATAEACGVPWRGFVDASGAISRLTCDTFLVMVLTRRWIIRRRQPAA